MHPNLRRRSPIHQFPALLTGAVAFSVLSLYVWTLSFGWVLIPLPLLLAVALWFRSALLAPRMERAPKRRAGLPFLIAGLLTLPAAASWLNWQACLTCAWQRFDTGQLDHAPADIANPWLAILLYAASSALAGFGFWQYRRSFSRHWRAVAAFSFALVVLGVSAWVLAYQLPLRG